MASVLLHDSDVLRLGTAVNAQRGAGLIPSGGLAFRRGEYFQLMVTGTSAQTYTIVAAADDASFQAKANVLSGLGAYALGPVLMIDSYFVQAFGDAAGGGSGGGGTPADGTVWTTDDALGGELPTVKQPADSVIPASYLVIDGSTTGGNGGVILVDGAGTPTMQLSVAGGGLTLSGPIGTGSVTTGATSAALIGPGGAQVSVGTAGNAYSAASGQTHVFNTTARPSVTNVSNLGSATFAWNQVYAQQATILPSDARLKTAPSPITDAVLDAWATVNFQQFKFLSAIALKGEAEARIHFGVIAQDIEAAFSAAGLDPFAYGILCYDEWEAIPDVLDDAGNVLIPGTTAGDRYAVRYEELLVLECALMRRELARLSSN